MPSFTLRIDIVGNTRDMPSLEAAKEMVQRQAVEVLANVRLLPYWGAKPPEAKLSISVNNTRFDPIPFIVPEPEAKQPEKENPFETM